MLNMSANFLSSVVFFYYICGIGIEEVGLCSITVSSAATCVTASTGDRIDILFFVGKSYVVSDTCSEAVLGM